MDWLRATHKYLLSFLKSDWQLEDYPVRVVSQEASTDGEAVPGWRAQIINWWLVGFGNSPAQALADLRKNLEAARAEGPLPRPASAGQVRIQHPVGAARGVRLRLRRTSCRCSADVHVRRHYPRRLLW